ncbi:POK18 protein, partial [Eubucco bourcierii]|nr:POK18 protein [Eubucco bourcierii]
MGALQPGLPNPAVIPEGWSLLIIDLKDCFFAIALHDQDKQRFAFTLLAINREGPKAHANFHQNTWGLHQAYNLPMEEPRAIVKACPTCSHHNQGVGLRSGVNPRGLR